MQDRSGITANEHKINDTATNHDSDYDIIKENITQQKFESEKVTKFHNTYQASVNRLQH